MKVAPLALQIAFFGSISFVSIGAISSTKLIHSEDSTPTLLDNPIPNQQDDENDLSTWIRQQEDPQETDEEEDLEKDEEWLDSEDDDQETEPEDLSLTGQLQLLNELVYRYNKNRFEWTRSVEAQAVVLNQESAPFSIGTKEIPLSSTRPAGFQQFARKSGTIEPQILAATGKVGNVLYSENEIVAENDAPITPTDDSKKEFQDRLFVELVEKILQDKKTTPDTSVEAKTTITTPTEKAAEEPLKKQETVAPVVETPPPAPKTTSTEPEKTAPAPTNEFKAPSAETKTTSPASQDYFIKFNNILMSEYIGYVSKFTGRNFIFDPADLEFRISIISNEPTSIENIMAALMQQLRINGLEMIEVGNNILIHKPTGINTPGTVVAPNGTIPPHAEVITRVFRLNSTDPTTLANVIRPMLSDKALVESLPDTRNLIVTELAANIERIAKLIDSIDSPEAGLEIGEYQAQNIPITSAIAIAADILKPIAKEQPLVLTPFSSKNLVYIVSTPGLVKQAIALFERIDRGETLPTPVLPIESGQGSGGINAPGSLDGPGRIKGGWLPQEPLGSTESTKFYIHKLQYRRGDQIQSALQAVGQSLQVTSVGLTNNDLISTINSVQWIESSNSLIFTGTPSTLGKVKELIDELDTALPQVLIEILVLETTVDDSLSFGVDWGSRFTGPHSSGGQAFLDVNSPLTAGLGTAIPTNSSPDASGLLNQAGFNIGVIGRFIAHGGCEFAALGALVKAIHTDRRIDVLLNPKIVVEDNVTAEFFVGINSPFQTQAISNDTGSIVTSNFEFRDIGSTLRITPLIGNNGIVTLTIEQEISAAAGSNFSGGGSTSTSSAASTGAGSSVQSGSSGTTPVTNIGPTTRKSTTKTKVHLPDGYFLILSGQIRDEKEEVRTQVPCLGGLPFLGAFFSRMTDTINKKNLMIFIRPQIVDIERINPITKRQQDIYKERGRTRKRWQYEVDEALDFFNIRDPYCEPENRPLRN